MQALTTKTVLQRVTDLGLHIDSGNRVLIQLGARKIEGGSHGLAILAAFAQPTSMSAALESLQPSVKGAQEWMDLTSAIVRLYQAGVLRDESREPPPAVEPPLGYGAAPVHIKMLNDRARTESFIAGIRQVVRPGDVVVEIGTGTGVLAVAAARAGAKHVYAIEESSIAESAQAIFEANGVADRITLVRETSTEVDLPERGDLLVSEMIGNEPLAERLLEVTADAVKRLLKPGARLVPSKIRVFGLPVTVPDDQLMKYSFHEESLRTWRSWYGVDFGPLATAARTRLGFFLNNTLEARTWKRLSEPALLLEADLEMIRAPTVDTAKEVTATESGQLNGVVVYFEAELGPRAHLTTHPAEAGADNHWRTPVWIPADSLSLQIGDRFELTYTYNVAGRSNGVRIVPR